MPVSDLERAVALIRGFARRRARRIIELPFGFVALDERFAASHDHNKVVVTGEAEPSAILAAAETWLGGSGARHRLVSFEDAGIGARCVPSFTEAGYGHEANVIMRATGAVAASAGSPSGSPAPPVVAVDVDGLRGADRSYWTTRLPDADPETIRQLVERRVTQHLGADQVTFLAVRDEDGIVRSHADLYVDSAGRVAQIEDLTTDPDHARRGFARAVLREAYRRSGLAGCDLVFLVADADDWPRRWYQRLGYEPIGETHLFSRS